jgi:hypothetical protein
MFQTRFQVRGRVGRRASSIRLDGLIQPRVTTIFGPFAIQKAKEIHIGVTDNMKRQGFLIDVVVAVVA